MSGCLFRRRFIFYCCTYFFSVHLFTYARGGGGGDHTNSDASDDEGVRLVVEPSDALAPYGGKVVLACRARSTRTSRPPRISWRHRKDSPPTPADVLPPHEPNRSQSPNGSLIVDKLAPSSAGWYQCVAAADGVGAVVSRPALVLLAEAPAPLPGPRTILGVAGSPLVLPCTVSPHPRLAVRVTTAATSERRVYGATRHNFQPPTLPLNVTWVRSDGASVRGREVARVSISASGALEFEPAAARDAARYRCNVSLAQSLLTADTPSEVAYRLGEEIEVLIGADSGVDSAPRFILTPQPTTVIEGSSVTLECAAVGNPRPEMVWLNNGVAIDLNDLDSRFYLVGAGSLRVQWARALDAGGYTCRAHNRLDSADYNTQLTVLSPPRVSIVGGAVVKARVRGDVTLRCEARGRPAPTVAWLKDGEPVTPNDHDLVLVDGDDLRIQGVLDVDAGMFQCTGSSKAGDAVATLRLMVLPPDDETLLNGSISKSPSAPHKWKSKTKSHQKSSKRRNPTLSESVLNSLVSYSGANTDSSADIENFDEKGNENGLGLTATAYTATPPVPVLVSTPVLGDDINDFDFVHASEDLDLESIEAEPSVNSTISAPRSLRAVVTSQRFVTLTWEEPTQGAEKVIGYLVLYKAEGSQRERRAAAQGRRTELNVPALQPNTTYVFRAVALGGAGRSAASEPARAATPADDWAWGAPRDLRAAAVSPTELRVSWQPPAPGADATATAPPDKYRVQLIEVESGREQWQSADGGATEVTVGGLRAGTEYGVRAAAAGGAASAELRVRTPPAAPAAPPLNVTASAASATSILVRWEAPPARTHRGPLTGYKIRYRAVPGTGTGMGSGGTRRRAESLTTPADARRAELRGLERGTTYQVRVCALNANGSGPFSDWSSAGTAPQELDESLPPPQPPPLRTRAGRDWISVWWSPDGAGSAGVRVRGYSLGWGLGIPDEHSRDLPPHTHSYVIRDLQSNAEYVISLRANNALGPGPPVYATVRTRDADEDDLDDPPDDDADEDGSDDEGDDGDEDDEDRAPPLIPPVGLKVIMLSGTTAVVYWTDPTLPRGQTATDGRRYVVRWAAAGAAGGRARTFNATDLNCMIDELKPFTTYEFAVKLIKGGRESSWSMLVSNTTLEAVPSTPPKDLRVAAAPNAARAVELSWAPPARPNGLVTGYVVMYAAERATATQDWSAVAVAGARTATRVDRLRARTTYLFKIQARNSKGLGPFSAAVRHMTAIEDGGGGLASATSAWLWASAGGACAVLALAAALALSLCCRRGAPPLSPDRSTYQKSAATAAIKPPDLWIHHDQMELKHMDKGLHGSAMSAGSVDGGGGAALMSSTLTLGRAPPAEYESARIPPPHPHPGSVDRRHYVPTYVERRCESVGSDDTAVLRSSPASLPAPCCRRCECTSMSSVGCAATCDRRPHRPPLAAPDQNTPLIVGTALGSPQPSLASLQPLHPPPGPCGASACPLGAACGAPPTPAGLGPAAGSVSGGSDVYAVARERGHYVAYEPLGHYTHRDSMSSDAAGAVGSLQRRVGAPVGGVGAVGGPLHSFVLPSEHASSNHSTPSHGKGSAREASPYKRSGGSSPGVSGSGSGTNRLALGAAVAAAGDELEPLTPSRSTERLHREMANLEGLMKDLSAITGHHQFQC